MVTIAWTVPGPDELVELYRSVGWSAYTRDRDLLVAAVAGSHGVVTAREDGVLVGLDRTVSDGATILYVQDVLVHPDHQRTGVGRALLGEVRHRYAHVRQTVLLTDDEPGQRAFYESLGFVEAHDVAPDPLRSFVLLR
ncbi:GNAT superfamily N-acetyltransferase [Curtobacterium luteum]|uniref:N-acetyltransferase n=1 Tax=Curtobacterium luteum TaxID=33881 RepID=A0A8H9G9W8_9MICO|nr:GNAT family N-acetyltransferase [Curtobacterium luteum]MBM7803468.1 GNAT superfamily N-acetyltransferase [Curtobacterium luteum]NUU50255.1 GNAT family N-acetyltransferase [Curtobacterium luteum]GGL00314.1 N-acetyltransferase [Curtobacterium luteum]